MGRGSVRRSFIRTRTFPHVFNTKEHGDYLGPYPTPSDYGIDNMSGEERKEFLAWYEECKDGVFDFRQAMEDYCRSDVDILRRSVMVFRKLLMNITREELANTNPVTGENIVILGVDPTSSVTIASICMNVFKRKFLHPYRHVKLDGENHWCPVTVRGGLKGVQRAEGWVDLDTHRSGRIIVEDETLPSPIAIVPSEGYAKKDQFSLSSIQWLEWISHEKGLFIQHALNRGEFRLPGHGNRADGYCPTIETVYQYDGCLFHGCPMCYPHARDTTVLPRTNETLSQLYALKVKRDRFWKQKGYKVVCIWEHEFLSRVQSDEDMKTFVTSLDLQERLDPRDSFFGGRTNSSRLYYEAAEGEDISYYDFCSLYPSVNKYGRYPIGHPEVITDHFNGIEEYFGIAKVKILVPRQLYHPVLPYRSRGKLKFALCRTCADEESTSRCQHSDRDRCFVGTWCTLEIGKVLEKGYVLHKIYEVYHWPESTVFDPVTKTGGLFCDYINTFLKIKQESSGWPAWCATPEDRDKYIQQYAEKEGIQLDPRKIEKNPGLRALSKMMLNSRKKGGIVCVCDPTFVPDNGSTNIFLAVFTTCHARMRLYALLESLEERVLYYDNDSVIFVTEKGQEKPPLGDYLGELTDELEGDTIQMFVSGGPKNYAFRTTKEKEVCKVRGFTLNYVNSTIINFHSVKDMVMEHARRMREERRREHESKREKNRMRQDNEKP